MNIHDPLIKIFNTYRPNYFKSGFKFTSFYFNSCMQHVAGVLYKKYFLPSTSS